jgi:biotin operon repressor
MKGFYIHVKNDLLEAKHYEAMGASIWLYLWLLDKVTSVDEKGVGKVLGGKPIVHSEIEKELGMTRRSYQRNIETLKNAGYIDTLRTPNGLVIKVQKTKKVFGQNDTKKTQKEPKSDVPKRCSSDGVMCQKGAAMCQKGAAMCQKGACNIRQDKDKTITLSKDNGAKALEYGDPVINEMFDYWHEIIGYKIESKVKANRMACKNLHKKYGEAKLKQLITGVAKAQQDRYAPRIGDFIELQSNMNKLLAWGRSVQSQESSIKSFGSKK